MDEIITRDLTLSLLTNVDNKFITKFNQIWVNIKEVNINEVENIYIKDDKCLFYHDRVRNVVWCDYDEVWSYIFFTNELNPIINYTTKNKILQILFSNKNHLDISLVTPCNNLLLKKLHIKNKIQTINKTYN